MKRFLIIFIVVFACINTHSQDTYIGKIVLGGSYYFLETVPRDYKLTLNHIPVENSITVDDIEYFVDDIVAIKGTTRPSYPNSTKDFELEIETVKKWSQNHDIQRFLGEYFLEGTCEIVIPYNLVAPLRKTVVIEKGIESDLLIKNIGFAQSDFNAFVFNDNLLIPGQWGNNGILIEKAQACQSYSCNLDKGVYILRVNGQAIKFVR